MLNEKQRALLEIHLCVFLWGFTAILGKLIELRELPLVWYRVLITCISLLFFPKIFQNIKTLKKKEVFQLSVIGFFVMLHWLCFYGSIKFSNASVALTCLSVSSLITSFLEPLFFRKRINKSEIFLGFIVICGMYLIFHFTHFYVTGIILGLIAAFLSAIFITLNKKMVTKASAVSITFVELGSGLIFLSLLFPFYLKVFPGISLIPQKTDIIYLFILSIVCTTLPYMLSLKALRHISAFTGSFTINLEPVYGIIMAILIFKENKELSGGFYIGTLIILLAIFLHPLLIKGFERYKPKNE